MVRNPGSWVRIPPARLAMQRAVAQWIEHVKPLINTSSVPFWKVTMANKALFSSLKSLLPWADARNENGGRAMAEELSVIRPYRIHSNVGIPVRSTQPRDQTRPTMATMRSRSSRTLSAPNSTSVISPTSSNSRHRSGSWPALSVTTSTNSVKTTANDNESPTPGAIWLATSKRWSDRRRPVQFRY